MRFPFRFVVLLLGLSPAYSTAAKPEPAGQPNVIVIMTDDMGYSDLGCFGSEIDTPNLDTLAAKGLRFSRFYNAGRCCPTRASLLTGLYSHQSGVGAMTRDEKLPGYRGFLNDKCMTIAEVLKPAGYHTIQTGKWHLGSKQRAWWPLGRGFDDMFSCPLGGGFYFRPSAFNQKREVMRNDEVLYTPTVDPPKGWYTTDAYTDEGLAFVRQAVEAEKPFFWYLAYNAPHWPLRAKVKDIAKYRGRYMIGWDKARENRHQRLIELGLIPSETRFSPRHRSVPAWDTLSAKQKKQQDHIMATYAAAVDCVDQNVGKLVAELRRLGVYENTIIVFLCDNGGSPEISNIGINKAKGEIGTPESFVYYGKAWANVSNTPYQEFKSNMHEGGIATPFVVHWPKGIDPNLHGSMIKQPAHLIDLMATFVDITGAKYPKSSKGKPILPMEGVSLSPFFNGKTVDRSKPLFFEHGNSKAVRDGKWKIVADKNRPWELYDMEADPTELNNLAVKRPEIVKELSVRYETWAERCYVNRASSNGSADEAINR